MRKPKIGDIVLYHQHRCDYPAIVISCDYESLLIHAFGKIESAILLPYFSKNWSWPQDEEGDQLTQPHHHVDKALEKLEQLKESLLTLVLDLKK